MPKGKSWTVEEEKQLRKLREEDKALEEIAEALNRSPEAVAMKLKRVGLSVPNREKHFAKNSEKKNSFFATTTTRLEPVKAEELPSANEMMGLLVAAIRRLQQPDVTKDEVKKLRTIIQAAKSYIHLEAGVVLRLRHVESDMLAEWRHLAATYENEIERANTEEGKDRFRALLQEAQQHIKEMVEMGVKEPKSTKEARLS
jgi:hypothetical protein